MQNALLNRFSPAIRTLTDAQLGKVSALFPALTIEQDGPLRVCYAPFEWVNTGARLVIVGITPGFSQMSAALKEARRQLALEAKPEQVLRAAKLTGAFSGPMRRNLVDMLDKVGVPGWLGIRSAEELFGAGSHLVQTASVLRNPVFVGDGNYNGSPDMTRHPMLRAQMTSHFAQDLQQIPGAHVVALGDKVAKALDFLVEQGSLSRGRVLGTLPHPSAANAERIAYFLGRKDRAALSRKTDPDKIGECRERLVQSVARLG